MLDFFTQNLKNAARTETKRLEERSDLMMKNKNPRKNRMKKNTTELRRRCLRHSWVREIWVHVGVSDLGFLICCSDLLSLRVCYGGGVVEVAKEKINEAIANHFDINTLSGSLNPICVADLGCSTRPNTFFSVKNIIEAIELKYISKGENTETPKFMEFFNDQFSNDFNTLFISLPLNRQYFAAGVPGSFYGRLFPKASLHFIHSSYALQ
nr:isoform 2 of probable s-adenosylmethionine-dependent methyltransferase at5g38100 [Quercus suber]